MQDKQLISLKSCLIGAPGALICALRQEGLVFSEEDTLGQEAIKNNTLCIFLGRAINPPESECLQHYLLYGGVAICDALNRGCPQRKKEHRNASIREDGIELYAIGKGYLIYIDRYLNRELSDYNYARKEFITSAGVVSERVAFLPKADIRQILAYLLYLAANLRGVPFLKVWYYPAGRRCAFNFRFDIDEDAGEELEKTAGLCRDWRDCTGWFISCASFEKNASKIKELTGAGFDVQSHSYYHHAYRSKRQNALNIDKSIAYFQKFNHSVEGFAAPKGIWNTGLQGLLEERGFLYSSEFSLDYDNFPFYPVIAGRFSPVLQIPIHPVCIGLYTASGIRDSQKIGDYFQEVILAKYGHNLPVFLYGHPNENLEDKLRIWRAILEKASSLENVWRLTFSELAKWWKKRDELEVEELFFDIENRSLSYRVRQGCDIKDITFCIHDTRERAFFQLKQRESVFNMAGLEFEQFSWPQRRAGRPYEERILKGSFISRQKALLKDTLDWEECTPRSQLCRDTLTANIKYYLRALRPDIKAGING